MKSNIPSDWDNETWASFCIEWPDSDHWRAILAGLINMPSRGRNWTNDSGTVKDAQAIGEEIWTRFLASSQGCANMDVRQNPDNPCELDKDLGDGWEQFADLSLCGAQMFEDPPYTGPDFTPSTNDCLIATRVGERFYSILLDLVTARATYDTESELFFAVIQVLSPYTAFPLVNQIYALVTALLLSSDGTGLTAAYIMQYKQDVICALLASLETTTGENDFVRFAEMRDRIVSHATGYSFEGSEPLVARQVVAAMMQACHSADLMQWYYISDIEEGQEDCEPCGDAWCYRFDFTASDGDWDPIPNAHVTGAEWTSGTGWEDTFFCGHDPQGTYLMVRRDWTPYRRLIAIRFRWYQENTNYQQQYSGMYVSLRDASNNEVAKLDFEPGVIGWQEEEFVGDWDDVTRIDFMIGQASCPNRNGLILQWLEVEGYGTNPFGEDNCT